MYFDSNVFLKVKGVAYYMAPAALKSGVQIHEAGVGGTPSYIYGYGANSNNHMNIT